MSIDPLSQSPLSSLTTTAASATSNSTVNKDEFMKLLVAQLQHQDPLNPQQGADFVAQLAQFSSLEQTTATNEKLDQLAAAQASTARADMVSMVGKSITAKASSITIDPNGGSPPLSVHLDGPAKTVEIDLLDGAGNKVRALQLGAQGGGDVAVNWALAGGGAVPPGSYSVQVKATASDGKTTVNATPSIQGVIDSLSFQNGASTFRVGGVDVTPADILSVHS